MLSPSRSAVILRCVRRLNAFAYFAAFICACASTPERSPVQSFATSALTWRSCDGASATGPMEYCSVVRSTRWTRRNGPSGPQIDGREQRCSPCCGPATPSCDIWERSRVSAGPFSSLRSSPASPSLRGAYRALPGQTLKERRTRRSARPRTGSALNSIDGGSRSPLRSTSLPNAS